MKLWWVAALSMVMASVAIEAAAAPGEKEIKAEDGQTLAVAVVCSSCQSAKGKAKGPCDGGGEQGWLDGQPCGKCLLESNYGTTLRHSSDLHLTGKLVDRAGKPVASRFVKLFLANGWSVRTKTSDQGTFRLMLGATAERTSRKPLVTDLGNLVDARKGTDLQFAIYLLPPSYKPCAEAASAPEKPKKK